MNSSPIDKAFAKCYVDELVSGRTTVLKDGGRYAPGFYYNPGAAVNPQPELSFPIAYCGALRDDGKYARTALWSDEPEVKGAIAKPGPDYAPTVIDCGSSGSGDNVAWQYFQGSGQPDQDEFKSNMNDTLLF